MPDATSDPTLSLPDGTIHLWLAYYDEINDQQLHRAYRQILNDEERKQEPRFYFERDRRRYLVTRALVRTVLSRYSSVHPENWIFSTNEYGRPEIANLDSSCLGLTFNISHTHALIVIGVARNCALGVDVENVRTREVSIDIADRYFATSEVSALMALPPNRQQYRFFEYWTFKESYIKARGMGLSLPLDEFWFNLPTEGRVEFASYPSLDDRPGRWRFWQFQPTPEYLVAVCAQSTPTQAIMPVRQIVPMRSEKIICAEFLRTS